MPPVLRAALLLKVLHKPRCAGANTGTNTGVMNVNDLINVRVRAAPVCGVFAIAHQNSSGSTFSVVLHNVE